MRQKLTIANVMPVVTMATGIIGLLIQLINLIKGLYIDLSHVGVGIGLLSAGISQIANNIRRGWSK